MVSSSVAAPKDRPLSGGEKTLMVVAAFLAIGLFYVFSLITILLLLVLLVVELAVFLVAVRFFVSRFVLPVLQRHFILFTYACRSFWLREAEGFALTVSAGEAPGLFAHVAKLTAKFEIEPPKEIVLVNGVTAWVKLGRGSRGSGAPKLGLGYDLIAALSADELEAVLAHELAHAKLVRRTMSKTLYGASHRSGRLAGAIGAMRNAGQGKRDAVASGLFWVADKIARLTVRLVARYSRQDEFEADAGAASTVGSAPLRSSLLKLQRVSEKTARIGWNERVAQLQQPNGFATWLSEELSTEVTLEDALSEEFRSAYSTHPSLSDRLAALPADPRERPASPKATTLLADPDALALRLAKEIRRLELIAEKKDDKAIKGTLRKLRGGQKTRWPTAVGLLLILLAGVFCFSFEMPETRLFGYIAVPLTLGAGIAVMVFFRPKEKDQVPYPTFSSLLDGEFDHAKRAKIGEREKQLEDDYTAKAAKIGSAPAIVASELAEARAALLQGDYLRAHVASRRAYNKSNAAPFACQMLAIAAGAIGNPQAANQLLVRVRAKIGFQSDSSLWGAAWALFFTGELVGCEVLLQTLRGRGVREPVVLGLLGRTMARRNKFQTGLAVTLEALAIAPEDRRLNEQLIDIHLGMGSLAEAEAALAKAQGFFPDDRSLRLREVRLALLRHDDERANRGIARYAETGLSLAETVDLATHLETARRDNDALAHYDRALEGGYFPAAHLGRARLALHRKDGGTALAEALASMDLEKQAAPDAAPAAALFAQGLSLCLSAYQPVHVAEAWTAAVPQHEAFGFSRGLLFTVMAPDFGQAKEHLATVLKARTPSKTLPLDKLFWQRAPDDRQPAGSVRPGIHGVDR